MKPSFNPLLFYTLLPLLLIACQSAEKRQAEIGPPPELIAENFEKAEAALEISIENAQITDSIKSDTGFPGYVILHISGNILSVYKGGLTAGEMVEYDCFIEYDPGWRKTWATAGKWIVFLKADEKTQTWRALEFGQFSSTDSIKKLLRDAAD